MARKKRSLTINTLAEAVENSAPEVKPKKTRRAASVKSIAVKSKFNNKITIPFAETGLKLPFPDTPQEDGLINRQEGFTLKYRTPINAGGAYIKMENFNQIINETQTALKETQEKCVTSVNGSAADETGNVAIDVSGLVKSVNETLPDAAGNIALGNLVKSVNEIAPDINGNAEIGVIVHSVNSIHPDNTGNVSIPNAPDMTNAKGVLSVANGGTGATTAEEARKALNVLPTPHLDTSQVGAVWTNIKGAAISDRLKKIIIPYGGSWFVWYFSFWTYTDTSRPYPGLNNSVLGVIAGGTEMVFPRNDNESLVFFAQRIA